VRYDDNGEAFCEASQQILEDPRRRGRGRQARESRGPLKSECAAEALPGLSRRASRVVKASLVGRAEPKEGRRVVA